MSDDCGKYEREIAAAAGGELPSEVADHLSACARCAELRAVTTTLASARGPELAPSAAVALARKALDTRKRSAGRAPLWVAPLVSASATAAALILYFGLFASPAAGIAQPLVERQGSTATEAGEAESALAPRLPTVTDLALPETFEASHDMLLVGSSGGNES